MDAAVFGLMVADLIASPMDLRQPPAPGGLHLLKTLELTTGGNACNVAMAMAKLGMSVAAAGMVGEDVLGQTIVARPTAPFRNQAGGAPVLQTGQQPKHLPPLQAEQFAGVCDTQTARPNAQQNFEPIEFLLAHRHHRHRAPPRPLEPRAVSRQLCRGVSSLYCGYMSLSHSDHSGKF